jgi:hypothetical protein
MRRGFGGPVIVTACLALGLGWGSEMALFGSPIGKHAPASAGTQGNSPSDPDDDGRGPDRSNGGPDKPGGAGGVDVSDQDGNNGCGNDVDREDDNEGWCGGRPTYPAPVAPKIKAGR